MADHSAPRFELRLFAPSLADPRRRLEALLEPAGESRNADVYLLGLRPETENLKVRADTLQRKRLIHTDGDLEQWQPMDADGFPLAPARAQALFGLDAGHALSAGELLDAVCRPRGAGVVVHLRKHRVHYRSGDVLGEFCELTVNGARLQSVAIESADVQALRALRSTLGWDGAANVSYVRALRRFTGLERLPADSPWRSAPFG